ncbi:MAG: alpha/beta hydrolase [Pseudomonadota bacterium]
MKKFFGLLAGLLLIGAVTGTIFYLRAAGGVPAETLESTYVKTEDRFVDISGARVRVREEGASTAPVVLLVHGFTHSLETWDGWAAHLKDRYRVIRYDLLGHGLTGPDPNERYAPDERAAFIGDLMSALDIKSAFIAGNSLGGLAAWKFAAINPDRVRGLILVSPGAFSLNGVSDKPAEIPAAMKAYLMTAPEAGVRASAELIYADDSKITEARLRTMRDMIRRKGNGAALIKSLEEFTLPDPSDLLQSVAAPTLIIWGEDDVIIPIEQGRQMTALMQNAALKAYPGVGHAAQEEAPAETIVEATAFLDGLSETPTQESN